MSHEHDFKYGDIPGVGECACGAYRYFNRFTNSYEIEEVSN